MSEPAYMDIQTGSGWDASILEPLAELNLEILEVIARAVVPQNVQAQWRALRPTARLRVARWPYLLLDADFARPEHWIPVARAGVHEAPGVASHEGLAHSPLETPLLRQIVLFAWHLARTDRIGARIALGMSVPCASAVAGCRFADLEVFAECRPPWIRPRWYHRPDIWRTWFAAAAQESPRTFERLTLWGLQMLASEAVGPPTLASRSSLPAVPAVRAVPAMLVAAAASAVETTTG